MIYLEFLAFIFILSAFVLVFFIFFDKEKDDESFREEVGIRYRQKKNFEIEKDKLNRFINNKKENKQTLYFPPEDDV